MTAPFVILALPRSRTFWLSRFLSYGDWTCGHDEARHVRSLDDIRSWLSQPFVGTVETAAMPFWRLIRALRPDTRVVLVRRPVAEVVESWMALPGVETDRVALVTHLERMDRKLDQIERRLPAVVSVDYASLADEDACRQVFEYCLPYQHDHAWWARCATANMQVNVPAMLRYAHAHGRQLRDVAEMCRQQIRAQLWADRPPAEIEGMTIQEEPWEVFWRDGKQLFAEHCQAVGEPPDQYLRKNVALFERLASSGSWQVLTARSNGRMFGYLATITGPSIENPAVRTAAQTLFYVSPDTRGLGPRLQRESLARLEARGGRWEVYQRAGVRGDGPRLGKLYRRMGAEDFGHLYKLTIGEAA